MGDDGAREIPMTLRWDGVWVRRESVDEECAAADAEHEKEMRKYWPWFVATEFSALICAMVAGAVFFEPGSMGDASAMFALARGLEWLKPSTPKWALGPR